MRDRREGLRMRETFGVTIMSQKLVVSLVITTPVYLDKLA